MSLRIDLQTHTKHSPECGWMSPERLVYRARAAGLDGVAITDHNTMAGVEPARRAAGDDFVVIPAEEIDTTDGQIIGLYLSDAIEPGQPPSQVLSQIHAQGGIALAPHPFDELREGLKTIEDHVKELDCVEVLNSRCIRKKYNDRARAFGDEYGLTATAGSDAHFAFELGTAVTEVHFDGDDLEHRHESIQSSLQSGRTTPSGTTSTPLVHALTKCAKGYNRVRR